MAPLWSILNDLADNEQQKPIRFYYGARAKRDLFYEQEIASLATQSDDFRFVPALSEVGPGDDWDGATGLIHEIVSRDYAGIEPDDSMESYACGPPPMVEAILPVFQQIGIDADHIHLDKFTPAAGQDPK